MTHRGGVPSGPVLHLMSGLSGSGKTTVAKRIASETGAVRLTPDEWMIPLFGDSDAGGRRDVLEGRLIWTAVQVVHGGGSAILDFGCWSWQERYAIRSIAELAGARFELHHLDVDEAERRRRTHRRFLDHPESEFEMTDDDHARQLHYYARPTADELAHGPMPPPADGADSWSAWAADRWPGLAV